MKKYLLLFLMIFTFSQFPICSAAADLNEFMEIPWGSEFQQVTKEKDLVYTNTIQDNMIYESRTDNNENYKYTYIFYQNKLISGTISCLSEDAYDYAIYNLVYYYGQPNWDQNKYDLQSTFIEVNHDKKEIYFTSKKLINMWADQEQNEKLHLSKKE